MKNTLKSTMLIIISSILFLVFPITVSADETDIENQVLLSTNFESKSFQGWAAFGSRSSISLTDETAYDGKHCIRTSSRMAAWTGPSLSIINLVEAGTTMKVQAFVKGVNDDVTPTVAVSVKAIASSGGESYYNISDSVVNSTDWSELNGTYEIPQDTTELIVYFQTFEGTDDFYVDNIKIFGVPKGAELEDDSYNGESYSFDFERNLQKWIPRGEVTISKAKNTCYSGNYSLYVEDRQKYWHGPQVHVNEVKPGLLYNYTAYVMYNGSEYEQNHTFSIKLQYNLNGIETYSDIESKVLQKGTWSKISGDFTAPKGAENIVFYIQTADVADGEETPDDLMSFYIDNITIVDVTDIRREQTIRATIIITAVIVLVALLAFIVYKLIRKSQQTKKILMSASLDAMTKAFNRNTFEDFMKTLEENPEKCKKYYMTVCDVNFLKYINDNYGHEEGDKAIIRCAEVLLRTIGKKGKVYRTGGDEFMCVTKHDPSTELKNEILLEAASYKGYPFSVAVGTAHYDETIDFETPDIKVIIKRSDKEMYKHKQEIKKFTNEFSKEFALDRKSPTS